MKRKMSLICCLLALTVLSSIAFLACEKKPAGPTYTEPTAAELELVLEMIETDHKKAFSDATPANYELNTIYVLSPAAAYLQYTVAVDTTGGAKEDDVKVVNSAENNKCTVEVNSKSKIEIPYTLTVTLVNKKGEAYKKDDGSLYTVSFSHKIPAYTLVTFEEFVKAADDKSEQTVTVVGYLTGIISTSSGSKGSIYLVDKQGYGYYAYGPTGVITDSITNDEQLRTAWPVGTEIEVSGTATCYNGQYEFNKGCSVTKTGNSVTQEELYVYRNATADWGKAIDNKDKALIPYQNALVELNNAKMVSVSSDNKYYYFTVNGKQFNLYNTNYFMDGEDVKTLLKKFEVGKQATIKGLVSVYSEAYQIYPLGLDAISDVTDATFSNQEKLDATKAEFTFDTKYAEDKEVPLPTTGKAFTDVTIEWALDKDYPGITLNNNVLTVTLQETEQKAKLTATLKIGSDSTTKDFDISVDAIENVEYEPVIINAPAIGDYKIVMDTTAAGGSVLYFDGTLNSKGALNSTDKASKAANVTVAAVEGKEGVYTLNVAGKYLVGYLNGTFNNMKLADEPGEWTWNTELKTFVCTFADKDGKQSTFYFGTYVKENVAGNTFALSKISYVTGENANKVGVSQFVGQFATLSEVEYVPVANKTALEGNFIVFMDTTAAGGSVLYFDGTLNSKGALNSTDKASKATNVTVAAVEGKEGVYTLKVNGKYLVGYLNGTFNNMKLADEPGEWTWNTELKTFVCTFADKDGKQSTFYFGTYVKENVAGNTFALSKISYVTGENANKVGVSQFVGQFGTMQKKSDIAEPTDEEKLAAIIAKMSTEVTADFDLDATATWVVTSGSAIVIENGKAIVTRPAAADGDATVVLTATLNGASKEVTITVKALPAPDETEEDIVNAAFALAEGESLPDTKSLTGVIVDIVTPYSTQFSNITVNIKLYEKVIQCFRLKGEGANLLVIGDKIKVTGTIKNHNGTVEFDAGCTFELVHRHTWDEGSVTKEANCTEKGTKVYNCTTCSETKTEEIPAIGHKDENADGKCDACGADMPSEISLAATFTLGKNVESEEIIHGDGTKSTTYAETAGNYTLKITNGTNLFTGANDAKGNGCLKLGTSKVAGSFSFTVDGTVKKVKVYVAAYKDKSASVNGTKLTKLSDNGEYDVIEIDTSTEKTVTITVTSGNRAMVNTIEFYA